MGDELQKQSGDDPERALAAHQKLGQVVAHHALAGGRAGGQKLARGQDGLKTQDVVPGHAVFDAGRAAGVGGRIAAEGAHVQAGRVRRVEQAQFPDRVPQGHGHHPGLDHGQHVCRIDGQDAVHRGQIEHHPAVRGQGPSGQPRAGPARGHREAVAVGQDQDVLDVPNAFRLKAGLGTSREARGIPRCRLQVLFAHGEGRAETPGKLGAKGRVERGVGRGGHQAFLTSKPGMDMRFSANVSSHPARVTRAR